MHGWATPGPLRCGSRRPRYTPTSRGHRAAMWRRPPRRGGGSTSAGARPVTVMTAAATARRRRHSFRGLATSRGASSSTSRRPPTSHRRTKISRVSSPTAYKPARCHTSAICLPPTRSGRSSATSRRCRRHSLAPRRSRCASARVPADAVSLARGRALYADLGCDSCHGADGRRREKQRDAKHYLVITRDLTAPWTFVGGSDPEQLWLRLTTLSSLSPMPSYAESATLTERWHVVNYVLSLARTPAWQPGGHLDGPGQHVDPMTRGEYLVHAEMCGLCHTPISRTGIYRGDDFYLAGGMRVGAYPHGVFVSRNLTGDPDTGLGRWSEVEIATAMRD